MEAAKTAESGFLCVAGEKEGGERKGGREERTIEPKQKKGKKIERPDTQNR